MKRASWMLVVIAVTATLAPSCSGKDGDEVGDAPDPEALAAKPPTQACEAVAPRVAPCIDEVFVAQAATIDDEVADVMREELAAHEGGSVEKARSAATALCAGGLRKGRSFVDAVVACWDETTCKAFATCVVAKDETFAEPAPTVPDRLPVDEMEMVEIDVGSPDETDDAGTTSR